MNKQSTWILTAISAVLFLVLTWAFGDRALLTTLWNSDAWHSSALITYVLLAIIIACGYLQVQRIPASGVNLRQDTSPLQTPGQVRDPRVWELLMGNTYLALAWLPLRFFVGRQWFSSGWGKSQNDAWVDTGVALQGFWERIVQVPEQGSAPIYYDWYRDLIQYMLDNEWYTWFAKVVVYGEILIGLGLIVGGLTGIAAFFGTTLNFSFMMAGTTSSNPVLFGLGVFLVLGWKVAGYWGLDRYLLPLLGTPWGRFDSSAPPAPPSPRPSGNPAPSPTRRSSRGNRR